jgi:hypothetical protein
VEDRTICAGRWAKILEWRGDEALARLWLERAVGYANPGAIENRELGTVKVPPPMPNPSDNNTKEMGPLVNAVTELAVFLARRGEEGMALAMLTQVLKTRMEAPPVENPRIFNKEVGDPCMIASTKSNIGELMFAMGKKEDGVAWTEKAFEEAWRDVEYRLACKECCEVAAGTLVAMGRILQEEAGKPLGWFESGRKREAVKRWAETLVEEYEWKQLEVKAVRAVKDAQEAVGGRV